MNNRADRFSTPESAPSVTVIKREESSETLDDEEKKKKKYMDQNDTIIQRENNHAFQTEPIFNLLEEVKRSRGNMTSRRLCLAYLSYN